MSNHWTGLEWTTGLEFFWFYTFLRMELLYIWVTCDNISVLSGEYDTLILKSSCDSQLNAFLFTATLLYGM